MGYSSDRAFADRFIPEMKRIIGPLLLEESTIDVDQKQATDLIVLMAKDMRIACRVRRHGYADRYPYQFTIRSRRDNGAETELEKIKKNWGDWMFYGHAMEDGISLDRWWLINLHSLRYHMMDSSSRRVLRNKKEQAYGQMPNGDGTYFTWFDLRYFPKHPPILIESSHPLPSLVSPVAA